MRLPGRMRANIRAPRLARCRIGSTEPDGRCLACNESCRRPCLHRVRAARHVHLPGLRSRTPLTRPLGAGRGSCRYPGAVRELQIHMAVTLAGRRGGGSILGRRVRAKPMEKFVIEGGVPLSGTLTPAGNKNAALPILAACVLTEDEVLVRNVPR